MTKFGIRVLTAAVFMVAAIGQMASVAALAREGRGDAAAWQAAGATLTWIATVIFVVSAAMYAPPGRHAQARSSEDRATAP